MAESLADLVVRILMDKKDFNSKLNQLDKEVQNKFGAIQKHGMQLATGLGAASVAVGVLGKGVMDAASDFEVLKLKLKMAEGSTAAASKKFDELMTITKKATDIDLGQLIGTHNIMKKLNAESTRAIPALAGAANELKEAGVSISSVGTNIALFMKGGKQASRAALQLEKQLGITRQTLKDFDSSFDMTGKNVKQNGEILIKYLNAKYGKNLDEFAKTNKSLMGELILTWQEFSAEIGETAVPTINKFLKSGIEMLKSLRDTNPVVKSAIGNFLTFAPPILAVGSGLTFVIAQGGAAIQVLQGIAKATDIANKATAAFSKALKFLASGTGILTAAIAATAIAVYSLVESLDEDAKASQKMGYAIQDMSEKELQAAQAFKKYQQGKKLTAEEVAKAITFAQAKINNANESGSKGLQKKAQEDLKNLREIQKGYKDTEKAVKDLAKTQSIYSGGVGTFMTTDVKIAGLEREIQLGKANNAQKRELLGLYRQLLREQVASTNTMITGSEKWRESVKKEGELIRRVREIESDLNKKVTTGKVKDYTASTNKVIGIARAGAEQLKKIPKDIAKAWKDVGKVSGKALEKGAAMGIKAAQDYKDALEELQNDIDKIKLSPEEYEAKQVMKKADYFREKGIEEVKIQEWIESQKLEIIKEYSDKQVDEIEKVQEAFERIGGVSSPLMSMEEMAASIHSSFTQNKMKPEVPTLDFNPPSINPPSAGNTNSTNVPSSSSTGKTGNNNTANSPENGTTSTVNKEGSQTVHYTINVAGITVNGQKAAELNNMLADLGVYNYCEGV